MQVNFSSNSSILIDYWRLGAMPGVKRGLYGGKLTNENVTMEHLQPASKGGRCALYNIALATKENNSFRNNSPLKDFLTIHQAEDYLKQFKGIKLPDFNGDVYIERVRETIKRCFRKNQ